jgi:hypothetical protein
MHRQDELLAKEDGRYFAIGKFGTGLASVATSERIEGRVVGFGLPSAPAVFLHLAHRAYCKVSDVNPLSLFDQHPQGIWPDDQGPLFDFLEDIITHVTFAFTALEAFANEQIPDGYSHTFSHEKTAETKTYGKEEVERYINLDEKLHLHLPTILQVPSPKGTKGWEPYRKLKRLRDRIIHLKAVDRKPSGSEDETIWGDLLRAHAEPFCGHAHALMGHYKPAVENRRYYGLYPYTR